MWREVSEQRLLSGPGMAGSHQWAGLENMEVLLLAWLLWDLAEPRLRPNSVGSPGTQSPSWDCLPHLLKEDESLQLIFLNFSKPQNHFLKVKVILELNIYVARLIF